jgi:hypothetical protein
MRPTTANGAGKGEIHQATGTAEAWIPQHKAQKAGSKVSASKKK